MCYIIYYYIHTDSIHLSIPKESPQIWNKKCCKTIYQRVLFWCQVQVAISRARERPRASSIPTGALSFQSFSSFSMKLLQCNKWNTSTSLILSYTIVGGLILMIFKCSEGVPCLYYSPSSCCRRPCRLNVIVCAQEHLFLRGVLLHDVTTLRIISWTILEVPVDRIIWHIQQF